jgi:hypothetical protein
MYEDDVDVVCEVIKSIHFNIAKPEQMNVYADIHAVCFFLDGQWKSSGDAAIHLARLYATKIMKHLGERDADKGGAVDEERASQFEDFHEYLDRDTASEQAVLKFIRKHARMAPCVASECGVNGDRIYLLVKRSAVTTSQSLEVPSVVV